ncbi:Putative Alcohol dehydrogenase [[Torrubiella] hemipterigena]|uniref:Putative Alcohol dehydrogenase n=1 Tax=[Torrubiella] hemipterigena TaxID=1531966 RepID=A0A0A1TS83_9HYPO|nr:Putative Alcohol dehydrogenase [[Torrubiella] hemipterigena]
MSLPSTYKAVVIRQAKGPFTIEDVQLEHPAAGQVLVKVLACGVCFSDVGIAHGEFGDVFPRTPGHEIVGDVVEVGDHVNGITVGQRVGGPWHGGHDGSCKQCQRGRFQICENALVNGYTKDGGFAEYVLLRAEAVVKVPKEMDPAEVAPLLCAGVTVFNGIRKMNVQHGGLVAVQGVGGLGHLAIQYASKMGYEVVAMSSGDDKADFAKQLGAHHYINTKAGDAAEALQKLGGADIIVQTAPNPAVVGPLINGLGPCGKLLCLAPVGPIEVNTVPMILKGLGVEGWPSGHAIDSEDAIRFANNHGVKCMIEKYPFADVQGAVDSLLAGKPRFRNVLVFE